VQNCAGGIGEQGIASSVLDKRKLGTSKSPHKNPLQWWLRGFGSARDGTASGAEFMIPDSGLNPGTELDLAVRLWALDIHN
jgi:hypothetical protein